MYEMYYIMDHILESARYTEFEWEELKSHSGANNCDPVI